ncbi:IS4 family transposase, partial [Ferrimicrobium acidiphilum]
MLVLADRNFPGYELWQQAAATGAELVWRIGKNFSLDVDEVLKDGSYLSRLKVPRQLHSQGSTDITVRV